MTQCTTQMFADDTKIFSPVANTQDREKLQKDFDSLCVWSDKNGSSALMQANVKFCILAAQTHIIRILWNQ